MGNKKYLSCFFIFFMYFNLAAQNAEPVAFDDPKENKNYFIKESSAGTVLYQRLSWEAVQDIFAFEFLLEKRGQDGSWKQIDKKTLNTNYIDVSLKPGRYRYRVSVINLLRQIDTVSEYRNFVVSIAYQPEVSAISHRVIYFDDFSDDFISVSGKNFHEETEFILKKNMGGSIKCKIMELDKTGKKAKIKIDIRKITPGEYSFTAIDPSGLNDRKDISFRYQKAFDAYISGGYACTGFIGNSMMKDYFNTSFSPLGGIFRMTMVPIKRNFGNFGFNITLSGNGIRNKESDYTLRAGFIFLNFNAAYILPIIKNRLNFDLHMGGGYAFLVNTKFVFNAVSLESPAYWYWGLTFDAGTAFQIYMYKKLYAEINLDHAVTIRNNFPKYIIQPSFSIGWEF